MKVTKAHFGITAIFLSGMLLDNIGSRFLHFRFGPPPPPRTREVLLDRFSHGLKLAETQREQIMPAVYDLSSKLETLRKESDGKFESFIQEAVAKMEPVLKPEQRDELHRMAERMSSHKGPPPHGRPGFGPPRPPGPPDGPPPEIP